MAISEEGVMSSVDVPIGNEGVAESLEFSEGKTIGGVEETSVGASTKEEVNLEVEEKGK